MQHFAKVTRETVLTVPFVTFNQLSIFTSNKETHLIMRISNNLSVMAVLTILAATPAKAQITINEVLASNGSINTDPDYGTNADWIELYNAGHRLPKIVQER